MSSWAMRQKIAAASSDDKSKVEAAFADDYAIHGGGFPIRVANVDQMVGVVVVSGLKQEHDHQIIVEVIKDFLK